MKTIIGIDCGTSHSTLALWQDDVKIFEWTELPGLNMDLIITGETRQFFLAEFDQLKQYRDAEWIVGVAGLDSKSEIFEADRWFRDLVEKSGVSYEKMTVFSDIELVLWAGAEDGLGIGLIAGTGSNCLGRDSAGNTKKVGGMSHILSDEGGGFSIGWKGLHLVTKMLDGRETMTNLPEEIMKMYQVEGIVGLKNLLIKSPDFKESIAKCATAIMAASSRGEVEAGKIVSEESAELVRMISTVNTSLTGENLPVYLAGGLFKNSDYKDLFTAGLHKYFPGQKVKLVRPIDGVVNYYNSNL